MNRKQIEVRQLEVRSRIRELAAVDELDEEQRSELTALTREAGDLDRKLAGIIASEEETPAEEEVRTQTPEDREREEMRSRAQIGDVFAAVMTGQEVGGAIRDYQQSLRMGPLDIPTDLLMTEEERATTISTGTADNQQATVSAVFPTPTSQAMGVRRVSVPVGMASFPTVTAPDEGPGITAACTAASVTAGNISVVQLKPNRLTMWQEYQYEQAAVFPMLDAVIRENLRMAMEDALDKQALLQNDGDNDGLLVFGSDDDSSQEETYASYRAEAMQHVDGRYANMISAVKLLVGPSTYHHMDAEFRGTATDISAREYLMSALGYLGVSAHVPDVSSTIQQAVFCIGGAQAAVQPVWPSVSVITDPYTDAASGEVRMTALALANFRVTRTAQYKRHGFKLS